MSNYVVIARFDDKTDININKTREKLANAGHSVQEWPPHITIAAYENIDIDLLCKWTAEFSKEKSSFSIALNSLSILPPSKEHHDTAVLCLSPAHSKTLVDFYYDFHQKHEDFCTGIGWYNSISHGNPIIHSTLALVKMSELQNAIDIVIESNVFATAKINALEVYTYPMELIQRFELKQERCLI